LVLAVPFYGYAWDTTTGDINTAKTYPGTGQTMMYRGAQKILADKNLGAKEYWDDKSLTPYLVYQENETWKIGFFENQRSLRYKMDLIGKLGLGGMAVWALGYEGEYRELWETISERF
jgi:spore germination protein YaaH